MKKVEIYLSDAEYDAFVSKIQKYQGTVMEHQDDGNYSDEERAEIINAFGSVPFYVSKGIKRQMAEMDTYIGKYQPKTKITSGKEDTDTLRKADAAGVKNVEEMGIPADIKYETKSESGDAAEFNFG